jgi:hypothetical protein
MNLLARALTVDSSDGDRGGLAMPPPGVEPGFTAFGLAQEKLIEPEAVPDELLGEMFALIHAGLVARAQR